MSHPQKRQCYTFEGESQAQREQGLMAEGEESTDNNTSSSTSSTLPRKMPAGGIPNYHQSPQRALSPPIVIANIPISPTDEASVNQMELVLQHALSSKAIDLVQFLLLKYKMKELTNKAESVEKVIKDDEQYYNRIFNQASGGLKLVFGNDVIEVDPVVHTYALAIALGITYDGMLTDVQGMPKTGLLIIALGVICMHDYRVHEDMIWRALNIMGVTSMKNHYVAGNAKKLFH
ncbi:melanoma-associated antigen 10-like [Mus caroli]|uniref:Melanoma-associated antigen 10-like n=1 Tax=Mus caroli TaxID=10089 RepID=A0A6P5P411_MUSCR|nr:melanoma-associated antigen 10-like [Mus caroli]